ncbi:hypothetical protein BO70DRAFT_360658 [Aspergillus heteromorphus CBS 117.55]|uniref:DUF6314 domain-containing protein n=1 Tax=Aspergillus heteromorphus CBS 117.55 TaxID=1448321 RepID=A0A317WKM5_9EURO|nr:uncharacterized protein BO70DRAFT_360658 [Aspergillus heteromorphus CBS 117.55]PWY86933.1 hypothetical protein BO70DRAFT_360658 [Aspergillus heteromorphus CBS 117.55]
MTTTTDDSPPLPTSLPPPQPHQAMSPTHSILPTLFTSLTRTPRWSLLRTLKSSNPHDINGDLHGTATFTLLSPSTETTHHHHHQEPPQPQEEEEEEKPSSPTKPQPLESSSLYTESGSLPAALSPTTLPLQWKKSYIWRLTPTQISVWFVKPAATETPEPDYVFHGMEFRQSSGDDAGVGDGEAEEGYVSPPVPPPVRKREISDGEAEEETMVVTARGNHLCINDMYRTAYAFRLRAGDGEVVSWASRHVVKGPKKNQDIVNLYSRIEPGSE